MMQLSIFMPSNRDFAQSRQAIETALAYCEARDAILILADNSGDDAKQAHWKDRFARLRYLDTTGRDGSGNFMAALREADTPFVLPMGDDDEIRLDPAAPPLDLAALPADHIGVRPVTEVWAPDKGVLRIKDFSITAATPAERILEYNDAAQGDNSAFYSIFRRDPYLDLMELFNRHHPTKAGYCDWGLVMALFSYGKMALDRATVFRYNSTVWADAEASARKNIRLYTDAGLPAEALKYSALLLYLDLFVFIAFPKAPLTPAERMNAIAMLGGALTPFLHAVRNAPDEHGETMRYLAELAEQEQDAMGRFHIALVMANQIQEGLKDRYLAYYSQAMAPAAGT